MYVSSCLQTILICFTFVWIGYELRLTLLNMSAFLCHFGSITIFTLDARWGWVVNATTQLLFLANRPGTHCTGDWVGPRAGLDGCRKSHIHRFDPWTIQPIASCYTDYTISALKVTLYFYIVLKSLKCIYSTYEFN